MIRCDATEKPDEIEVTFALPSEQDEDNEVALVGDFNEWDPTAHPLRSDGATRSVSVPLAAGRRYAFRYLREPGDWFNDEAADEYEPNEFGGMNSVIDLTRPR